MSSLGIVIWKLGKEGAQFSPLYVLHRWFSSVLFYLTVTSIPKSRTLGSFPEDVSCYLPLEHSQSLFLIQTFHAFTLFLVYSSPCL